MFYLVFTDPSHLFLSYRNQIVLFHKLNFYLLIPQYRLSLILGSTKNLLNTQVLSKVLALIVFFGRTGLMEIEITRKWEGAHRLIEGESKNSLCSLPHGHTWYVTALFRPKDNFLFNGRENLLSPFENLKSRWHYWIDQHIDHGIFLNSKDPMIEFLYAENPKSRIIKTPGDPSTEMIACLFKSKLECFLKADKVPVNCQQIKIQETPTNSVIYSGNPNLSLEAIPAQNSPWWKQADYSIS